MDEVWQILKKIVFTLLVVYFINFLIRTDFLFKFFEEPPQFDTSRYLFKILNLE